MRQNIDPLIPTTSNLSIAIAHIAETARGLASSSQPLVSTIVSPSLDPSESVEPRRRSGSSDGGGEKGRGGMGRGKGEGLETLKNNENRKRLERETVNWVLDTPRRLKEMRKQDQDAARRNWEEVSGILEKWESVEGVERVRRECEEVMGERNGGKENGG